MTKMFDWHPNPSLVNVTDYHVERRLPPKMMRATAAKLWSISVTLDQGQEGECVGHGWAHCLAADPDPNPVVGTTTLQNPEAEHLYERAQFFDGSKPDEQSGASVGGGAKAVQEQSYATAFHWMTSVADVQAAVLDLGPVVLGINWYADMMDVDAQGLVHPTGRLAGGHCLIDRGYDPATGLHTLHNSWGASWGLSGDCLIHDNDLALLLSQNGEACIPTKVAAPVPVDPDQALAVIARAWVQRRHEGPNRRMAQALSTWMDAKGL